MSGGTKNMPKTKKAVKTTARRADDGQRNDQQAIANVNRRLDRLESRTISSQKAASETDRFAARTRGAQALANSHRTSHSPLTPEMVLTPEEVDHHAMCRGGADVGTELVNNNIEPTIRTQKWKGLYEIDVVVSSNDAYQINIMSAANYDAAGSDTPKSFETGSVTNSNGLGVATSPGPMRLNNGLAPGAVISGTTGAPNQICFETTNLNGSAATAIQSNPPCPFNGVVDSGTEFRWQLYRIKVKSINMTIGSNRGGSATVIQTNNSTFDLSGTGQLASMMGRGIYRTFNDNEIGEKHTKDGYISMNVREGLRAFHHTGSNLGSATNSLGYTAAVIHLGGDTAASQRVRVFIELNWLIGGSGVRGIGLPHVVSGSVQDRVRETNQLMRAAGVMPSQQKAGEHIPAAAALHEDKAMQYALAPARKISADHPGVRAVKKFLGSHLQNLADAGFSAARHVVAL